MKKKTIKVMNHPDDSHTCNHHHAGAEEISGPRLLITLFLNFIVPVIQIMGGIFANSMALISDAAHNFSDFAAVLISYIAYRIGRKGASVKNTFGYKRTEVMAALLNVTILTGASIFIVYEAIHRLYQPAVISGMVVVWMAGVGVVGNGFSALLLHRDSKHNLNIRGAFLHMLGDFLVSVMVGVSGLILILKPWYWLDPLLSLLIVLFILKNCWSIFKEATAVLMNATPKGLDVNELRDAMERMDGVHGVHYLHAWSLSSKNIAFSCHVVVSEQSISQTERLADKIRNMLLYQYGIDHPTLQFETTPCGNGSMLCELSCEGSR